MPELLGTALQAVICGAVWSYGELAFACICYGRREGLGLTELAGSELVVAAGVRTERERGLRCTAGRGSACVRLLGTH